MDEDRAAAIERELAETRLAVAKLRDHALYMAGRQRILEGAVFALIDAHPSRDAIIPALGKHVGPVDASIISASESEDQARGAQELLDVLRSVLGTSA